MDEAPEEEPQPPQRTSRLSFLFAVLVIGGSAIGVCVYEFHQYQRKPGMDVSGFDIAQTMEAPRPIPVSAEPQPQVQSSLNMFSGAPKGLHMAGTPVPAEKVKFVSSEPTAAQRAKEKDFLKKYGGMLVQYHGQLAHTCQGYFAKYPVVRDIDKAFAAMPGYMAVKRQYDKDGNPFDFARGAIALPEVRAEIGRQMANPKAWSAAISMMLDTLKNQPAPKPIYAAAQDFLMYDPQMAKVTPEIQGDVNKNMSTAMGAIPIGADMTPLNNVLHDVAPPAPAGASPQ
jgi:hypothetical protein